MIFAWEGFSLRPPRPFFMEMVFGLRFPLKLKPVVVE
jgi:hypothetical protein